MRNTFIDELLFDHNWVTLIGMSGLGKSYWSRVLESRGFKRFCCDDMIEDRIKKLLKVPNQKYLDIGEWLGFPFDKDYKIKEKTYLNFEIDALKEIIILLQNTDPFEKIVIDTTGSAPYAGDAIMRRMKDLTQIIHLSVSQDHISSMLDNYLKYPRPVIWGNKYNRKPYETEVEALRRSYNELLNFREKLYRKYSHHSIPHEVHRS